LAVGQASVTEMVSAKGNEQSVNSRKSHCA
jgi:hypothetical protein